MRYFLTVLSLLTLLNSGTTVLADEPSVKDLKSLVTFYAMCDVPYTPAEDILLPQQISELPRDAEFAIHVGDIHRWIQDRPFVAQNILRVQIDQGGIAPPIKITVTDHPTEPFVLDRRIAVSGQ